MWSRLPASDSMSGSTPQPARHQAGRPRLDARSGSGTRHQHGEVTSPIQGTVLTVAVQVGDTVAAGELICVIEAMKMENEITAPQAGIMKSVEVTPGQAVRIGARLAIIDAPK